MDADDLGRRPSERVARWRSARSEVRCRTLEDRLWASCSRSWAPLEVETQWGATRGYHWRSDGEAIVLLHGGGMSSVSWAPYAVELVDHNLYAFDLIGDVGRSEQRRRQTSSSDVASWLDETLEAAGVDRAHLVGHSMGGFVALSTAAHRPERVASLVLLDPLGIAPLNLLRFMAWGVPVMAGALAPRAVRSRLGRRLRNPMLEDKTASQLVLRGMLTHVPGYPLFGPLADDELREIRAPVTLLVAGRSEPFDHAAVVQRADALIRSLDVDVLPDAGHALTVSHFHRCVAAITSTTTSG